MRFFCPRAGGAAIGLQSAVGNITPLCCFARMLAQQLLLCLLNFAIPLTHFFALLFCGRAVCPAGWKPGDVTMNVSDVSSWEGSLAIYAYLFLRGSVGRCLC